jgi:rhodanese-related sulfurtransferase
MFKFLQRLFTTSNQSLEQALRMGAVILDVRGKSEFEEGHIANSKNIPLTKSNSIHH